MNILKIFLILPMFVFSENFEKMMGEENVKNFVITPKDFENFKFYKKNYENFSKVSKVLKIPKKIHFIWLGGKNLPKNFIKNIKSWDVKNKNCEIFIWSDKKRKIFKNFKQKKISEYFFKKFRDNFSDSKNFVEKEFLVKYDVLYKIGGVVVDPSLHCDKSIENLLSLEFFTCLNIPKEPLINSSISISKSILGSIKKHPIIKDTRDLIKKRWYRATEAYPLDFIESNILRTIYRTHLPLEEAVLKNSLENAKIFPANYFQKVDNLKPIYANKIEEDVWVKQDKTANESINSYLSKISFKIKLLNIFNFSLIGISFLGCSIFFLKKLKFLK